MNLMQTHYRRFGIWQPCGSLALLFVLSGCTGDDGPGNGGTAGSGTGGQSGAGGATATGGVAGSSGSTPAGSSGTGGMVSAGGNMSKGGTSAGGNSAGGLGSGGSPASGAGGTNPGGAGTMAGSGGASGTGASGAGATAGGSGGASGASAGGSGAGGGSGGTPSTDDATIIPDPAWACGMEDGIPPPTQGELAFTITLNIKAEYEVGKTPYGDRRLLDVSGGMITGERLQGTVLTGGLEYELTLDNGVVEYQGINVLDTSAGRIFVRSCGVASDKDSGARIIPDFEATTSGANAFLNTGKWVATREVADGKMTLAVYDVAGVTPGEPRVEISKPEGVPPQPWECNMTRGTQGAQVFTENVTLGGSYSINNAKYGSRNIIPITGGTTTGRVTGEILNGGADYQLSGSLDAWYTLAPDNGEYILVRNCGAGNGLIPWFEAKVDGEFDFLNTQAYLSSAPGVGGGGVSITFYERN
jgi:hypothetical protein